MPLCKIWIYKYYKNVTNMIDIVISDCYTVKSLKNIFCKMKKKQKDMQMFRRHYEIQRKFTKNFMKSWRKEKN